ncbi:hypothetical protein ATL17_1574 [Maritalea mobilis]|uniref:Rap1a immunity protein domain-containing protein n=1 Tax=Maritalea mobilis TaxID=483324 RepID=A0A4R6VJ93_9HYPH|nr:Rap1a/Tai family immunity protein [Maritalea mobilis]TDQ63568.1 hypothetical protein ATL17_1574 [Maritalea mobilis]
MTILFRLAKPLLRMMLILVSFPAVVFAQETPISSNVNGNEIYKYCTSEKTTEITMCMGYLIGLNEGIHLSISIPAIRSLGPDASPEQIQKFGEELLGYCVPDGVTYEQQKDIFVSYLKQYPSVRHEGARLLYYSAFIMAFPCS